MFLLPNVTLVAVSSVDLDGALFALSFSSSRIQFADVKFLTSELIVPNDPKIKVESISKLNIRGYSKFILQDLHKHISTDFCLVVQADGFVLNPEQWQNEFLEYDYIGAPWPQELIAYPSEQILDLRRNRVGNGGFSLRSKKLLEITSKIDFDSLEFPCFSEDLVIGHYLFEEMLAAGIRFPPPALAAKFSIESPDAAYGQTPQTSFGFHGAVLKELILGVRGSARTKR